MTCVASIAFSFPFPSLLSSPSEPNLGRLVGTTFPPWSNCSCLLLHIVDIFPTFCHEYLHDRFTCKVNNSLLGSKFWLVRWKIPALDWSYLPFFSRTVKLAWVLTRELPLIELSEATVVGIWSVWVATLTSIMGSKRHWLAVSDNDRHFLDSCALVSVLWAEVLWSLSGFNSCITACSRAKGIPWWVLRGNVH